MVISDPSIGIKSFSEKFICVHIAYMFFAGYNKVCFVSCGTFLEEVVDILCESFTTEVSCSEVIVVLLSSGGIHSEFIADKQGIIKGIIDGAIISYTSINNIEIKLWILVETLFSLFKADTTETGNERVKIKSAGNFIHISLVSIGKDSCTGGIVDFMEDI